MIDVVIATVEGMANGWAQEAAKRRKISATDPVADTLEYVAGEVRSELQTIKTASHWLTVEEYAVLKDKSEQTVRSWIRKGLIPARRGKDGYRIPRDAHPKRKRAA